MAHGAGRPVTVSPHRPAVADIHRHPDFEAQNLRRHNRHVPTVHDWDSLARLPEATLAGAASGAPHGNQPVSGDAVRAQAAGRLRRANA